MSNGGSNKELLLILARGAEAWNEWRAEHADEPVDLTDASFRKAELRGVDLSHTYLNRINLSETRLRGANFNGASLNWADLREADLRGATMRGADLRGANTKGANFGEADLTGANLLGVDLAEISLSGAVLEGCRLEGANLSDTNLRDCNFSGAKLYRANLRRARLNGSDMSGVDLRESDLSEADLRYTKLLNADLRLARMQGASLDHADIAGIQLWETQRSGWSIRSIVCEAAFWDERSEERIEYAPGEFEKLYSVGMRVELVYHGGITPFEVNTLPALLHHLATLHPESGIRLKSIEETGGGVRVSIHVDEADATTIDVIRAEAKESQAAQVALRDNVIARLEIEKRLLLDDVLPKMLAASGQHVQITGSATNVVIAGGQASVKAEQMISESKEIVSLLREMMLHRGELSAGQAAELEGAAESVGAELQKDKPKAGVVAAGLGVMKEIAVKVVESATEKALLEHWQPMLHTVTHLLGQMSW